MLLFCYFWSAKKIFFPRSCFVLRASSPKGSWKRRLLVSDYSGVRLEYFRSTLEYLQSTRSTLEYFRSALGVLWSTFGVPSEYSEYSGVLSEYLRSTRSARDCPRRITIENFPSDLMKICSNSDCIAFTYFYAT